MELEIANRIVQFILATIFLVAFYKMWATPDSFIHRMKPAANTMFFIAAICLAGGSFQLAFIHWPAHWWHIVVNTGNMLLWIWVLFFRFNKRYLK